MGMLLFSPFASAQNTSVTDTIRRDTTKGRLLNQVDIRGTNKNDRNTSSTPLQTLKGRQLERLNSFSVGDAIRFFTGVQIKDYGGISGLKTVNVRSLGSNHTAVFYDGVQVGNAQNGQVDLGKFSLENIDEISLYNGQNSNLFQPAKGFSSASALYIQSKQPQFNAGEHTKLKAGFKSGSFGLINPSILWQQKLNNNVSSNISAELTKADGRYKFRETNSVYDTTAVRNNTDVYALRLEGGLNGKIADSTTWSAKTYYYHSARGLPGPIIGNKFNYTQRQWDDNFFVQGNYRHAFSKHYSLLLNAKYAHDNMRYLDPEAPPVIRADTSLLENNFQQQEIYISAANQYRVTNNWKFVLSADYQWNKLDADLDHFAYPTRNTLLTALATQLRLGRANLQATLLGTFIIDKVKQFVSAGNKQEYTPSFTATWQPFENTGLLLRAFYKSIFRMPTFNDLYYTVVGNSLLKPERAKQCNIGFTYNLPVSGRILKEISVQTDAYYNRVTDKIVAIPTANLFRWTMYNIGVVNIKGLEINTQSTWQLSRTVVLNAGLNYTYQQALDVTETETYYVPYIPLHSASLLLGADWRKWTFNYSYLYTGSRYSQKSNAANGNENYMEPWYTHDVAIAYNTPLYKHNLKLSAEINNVLNQDRYIVQNFPMPRRFYRFKISIDL
ncbi:TonB-dependent receptor [Mucilaginibacter gynuensis]|uniref:TonB-dependent receptor n=2 Tax=Mucilaginibacter gynuensis TaxID=1302236 RepID=A0ABP8FXU2_9SPHI